jgi:hypothetical protein
MRLFREAKSGVVTMQRDGVLVLVDRINILTASHHEPSTWNSCEKRSIVLVCFKAWMA